MADAGADVGADGRDDGRDDGFDLNLEAPAEPATVEAVQERLPAVWTAHPDLDPAVAVRFEMGLVEILGNVVEHAYGVDRADDERRLTVRVRVTPDAVEGELGDNGKPVGVDLGAVTMPSADAESGRGLALALAALDELHHERVGEANRWRLRCERATEQR